MTETQMQSAILEALGWVSNPCGWWKSPSGREFTEVHPPDYLHDLNAMREAEGALPSNHEGYAIELAKILDCNDEGELNPWDLWKISQATAAQRAEAFLRVKGLWKEI